MEKIVVRRKTAEPEQQQTLKAVPRKRLYIHIGMYKTGTTSIQYFLNSNMLRLNSMGFLYPSTGRHPRSHVQHALVAEAFSTGTTVAGDFALSKPVDGPLILKALLHEIDISGVQTVILSSESLCVLPVENVRRVGETFRDFDIIPIVYIRNFCDLADASYQTAVMHNATTKSFLEMGFNNWSSTMDLVEMCRNWSEIAYNKKIIVQSYDDPEHKNSVKSFAAHTGIDLQRADTSQIDAPLNSSVSSTQVIVKRELRAMGMDLKHVDGLIGQLGLLRISEKQTMVPPSLRKELTTAYIDQLKALAASEFVAGLNLTPEMLAIDGTTDKIYIPNLVQAVFALGRAIPRAKL